jgi:hypothetical protein
VFATVVIRGTSSDTGGGVIAGVEVSVDRGQSWHPADGTSTWSYRWNAESASGTITLMSRAIDDSSNIGLPSDPVTVTVANVPTQTRNERLNGGAR